MNLSYEKRLSTKGFLRIVGLDEAGRGAWAGPIVAGCVHIPPDISLRSRQFRFLRSVTDSKKLSSRKREELFEHITSCFDWSVGVIGSEEIDSIGIGQANKKALSQAALKLSPDYAVIDYFQNIDMTTPHHGVAKGDSKVLSIAAASIIAKVYRDRVMCQLHKQYPEWHFDQHKGYGTLLHRQQLQECGVANIHRVSYAPVAAVLL